MSSGSIRIIQLPEKSSVNTDDYMAVDSSANGTKKVKFTDLLDDNLSASNKAADAQATGEAINNISARVDNMINTQTNAEVTTLWTGQINLKNETANLSESINNFDFIDVYCGGADTVFARRHVSGSSVNFELQSQNMSDDASVQFMRWWETGLTISGTTATINKAIKCFWDDFSTAPIVSQATGGGIDIVRIDGVKIGHVENDEIVDARVGVDGTSYPTLGDAIRGQVTDLKSEISYNSTEFRDFSMSVLNEADVPNDFVYGRFLSGGFTETTSYARSRRAYPPGKYKVGPAPKSYTVFEYVSDTEGIAIVGSWTTAVNVFTATRPFYITFTGITGDADIATINSDMIVKRLSTESETLEDRVNTNASDIAELGNINEVAPFHWSKNRWDGVVNAGGYINQATGAVGEQSTSSYTNYIDISNGNGEDIIVSGTVAPNYGMSNLRYAFYDANKTYISGGIGLTKQTDSTLNREYGVISSVPANAVYMRFSQPTAWFTNVQDIQVEYTSPTLYTAYTFDGREISNDALQHSPLIEIPTSMTFGRSPFSVHKDTFSDGEVLTVENNSIMKNQFINFYAKIGNSFESVAVGHGRNSYGYYFIIDDTYVRTASNGSIGSSIPHGLTITEFIGVTVEIDIALNYKVTVTTKDGIYSRTMQINSSTRGDVFALNTGSDFVDATLSWNCNDYKCPLWAFGDSYFTLYSPTRWTYYVAKEWGYNNILLNAYPGEDSTGAFNDFMNAIKHGTPKYLLWCLGMNDKDQDSAPNANWLSKIQAVLAICEEKGITPILCTIPIVTSTATKNDQKNDWIRNSGYRYVDLATAIADVDGWLSSDGTHPSEIGGRFIALKMLSSVPEMAQGK